MVRIPRSSPRVRSTEGTAPESATTRTRESDVDLRGNLSQSARQRNFAAFAAGDVRVLVTTDIAARGTHVDDVGIVVHIDPPAEQEAYLHRSGRTARGGC
jgi:superfamily II DNA/RNA helicase